MSPAPARPVLRKDQPLVKYLKRGQADLAEERLSNEGIDTLIDELRKGRFVASGQGQREQRFATWTRFHRRLFPDTEVLPLTPLGIEGVAAMFKAAGYRS